MDEKNRNLTSLKRVKSHEKKELVKLAIFWLGEELVKIMKNY